MASPFTMANGISTCSGEFGLSSASAPIPSEELSTSTRRSAFDLAIRRSSVHPQIHGVPHGIHRGARGIARLLGALGHDVAHELGILLELLRAFADRGDLIDHLLDQRFLALETADAGGAAAVRGPGACLVARVDLV